MGLRTKLLLSLALAIILGISLASWAVYRFGSSELETSKRRLLRQDVEILAQQTEAWLQKSKSNVILWAELPIVLQVALNPGDKAVTAEACRLFQRIVETTGTYQSLNLELPDAACIASSIPARIGHKYMQVVYSQRPDFIKAVAGATAISSMFLSGANGRPIIAISVPVRLRGRIIAVLRAIIDMAFFDAVLLKPDRTSSGASSGIIDPNFSNELPEKFHFMDAMKGEEYHPLKIPVPLSEFSGEEGFIQYHTLKGEMLTAFRRIKEPEWIVVTQAPLQEVLAPIRHMGRVAFLTAVLMIGAVFTVVFVIMNPRLHGILGCLHLVQRIGAGNLDARLNLEAHDEIGRLAQGLNTMAASLASQRQSLELAERTYRGIFENAVEGIFKADEGQRLITANPSFARIMGYDGPLEIIGDPVSAFFAKPAQHEAFLAELQARGVVENFEFTFVRRDGSTGFGSLFARAEKDEQGNLAPFQGMLADITEKLKAARERQRAEEAENRLYRSRLRALRSQINPHFLFNILNSIDALAKQAPQKIPDLIRELSRYLRFTLTEHNGALLPLNLELDAITSYLKLEKIRFEDDLVVEIITSPHCGQELVPEFFIQPLVENAIKYGMKTSETPLNIAIRCTLTGESLEIEVANTGKWVGEEEPARDHTGIGLQNLRTRLDLLYPGAYSLTHTNRGGWIIAKMKLPLVKAEGGAACLTSKEACKS
jgi:PAS domain S-box-containing protein